MNGKIVVVGLGFGDENGLTLGILRILEDHPALFLRTEKHPVAQWLKQKGIAFTTFDEVYEAHHDFASVYREIADRLLVKAQETSPVVYAVPGHPMVAEHTVELLLQEGKERGIDVQIEGGISFLEPFFSRMKIDPIQGFQLLDGTALDASQLNPRTHQLIGQVYDRMMASEVKLSLMEVYPDEHPVTIVTACGIPQLEQVTEVPLYELDRQDGFTDLTSVYVPPVKDQTALYRRFDTLIEIIRHLRSPEGCPWDRKQTHESLRPYLLEESYEFLEAVAEGDARAMADELGDILLQVMLHAQIASEEGTFDIHEVIHNLSDKMIRRHPHVFSDAKVDTAEQVVANWEEIKKQERGSTSPSSILDQVSKSLPALMRAYELQKKAAKVGFDWDHIRDVFRKLEEELHELKEAEEGSAKEEEFGDLLFALVNLSRFLQIHPEVALLHACQKFERRFGYIEKKVKETEKNWEDLSLVELDQWWEEAKRLEKEGIFFINPENSKN